MQEAHVFHAAHVFLLLQAAILESWPSPKKDHYQILGLNSRASMQEIKKAFRKLSLRYHPDKVIQSKTVLCWPFLRQKGTKEIKGGEGSGGWD